MTIEQIIDKRGLADVLHFTTNHGLTGILASKMVRPRARLTADNYVEHVMMLNCALRYDVDFLDYVNLSVSRIAPLFTISKTRWHAQKDLWWCVLAFRPEILTHAGVIFTTTNNKYDASVVRTEGAAGLEQMFAQHIKDLQYPVQNVVRPPATPAHFTTSRQAEVLYPGDLSTDYLRTVCVATDAHSDVAFSQLEIAGLAGIVSVHVNPDIFRA